jgi:hypothetical protein
LGILVDDAIVVREEYRHMEMEKIGFVQRMTEQPEIGRCNYLSNCCRILTDCDEYGISFKYHYTVLCYGNYLTLFSLLASFT